MNELKNAIDILISKDIRPSVQRIAILDYLLKNKTHPTVDEIYISLNPSMPTLSKTTVYNVLKSLVENDIVLALNIDEKNIRYDAVTEDHSHLMCERCNKLFDIPQPALKETNLNGYKINRMHLYCWGICPECNNIINN